MSKLNRKTVTIAITVIVVAGVGVSAWNMLRKDTFESVARASFDAAMAGDGETFLHYMSTEEREAYGLSANQWSVFLDSYLRPSVDSWRLVQEPSEEFSKESDLYTRIYSFYHIDGRQAGLRVEVARTTDGLRTVSMLEHLLVLAAIARYGESNDKPAKLKLFYAMSELCDRDAQTLTDLGLTGRYKQNPAGIQPWLAFRSSMASAIEKMEIRLKAVPSP